MRPPMTAPGTIPRTTNRRSSTRSPAPRAATPASTIPAKIAAAVAIVSQRTAPSPRWTSGSKSNARTAVGTIGVRAGRRAVRIGGRHAQALMALLILRPRPRLRDTLAAELWPEASGPSAASLRQALWLIRSSMTAAGLDSDAWLEADQDTIGLRP